MPIDEIRKKMSEKRLKATPQRLAVYQALMDLEHPYAEEVVEYVRRKNPTVSVATVYNTLDTFEQKDLLYKLETGNGKMRYDGVMQRHFHIYDLSTDCVIDYQDAELDEHLTNYFSKIKIEGVDIKDIRLQIIGKINSEN
jgi:Fur family transcriptional regulator, peroxide stress response regulator